MKSWVIINEVLKGEVMACYKSGGCGIYEMYSCSECPASKSEYANKYFEETKKTGIIGKWKSILIGNCFNCLHAEDGSKIGKDGWLNCPKWGAANINPYGFCHMWEQKE